VHHCLKKARQVKSKVKSMLIIVFDIFRIVHKEFILAGQTVNSAYYSDTLWRLHENVRRLHPEYWQQKNWLLCYDDALFFTREFFTINSMTLAPPPQSTILPGLGSL
jgi:hypothetical protein